LRNEPQDGVAQLARRLGRNYKNVHADVLALTEAGLIEKHGRRLMVPYSEIGATLRLEAAPD
jgi:predicted transcriptional regulator